MNCALVRHLKLLACRVFYENPGNILLKAQWKTTSVALFEQDKLQGYISNGNSDFIGFQSFTAILVKMNSEHYEIRPE